MNFPNFQPIVDYKVNYESVDVGNGSVNKIESRIPVSLVVSDQTRDM